MLPRVTYSNIRADFSGVHAEVDRYLEAFDKRILGKSWDCRIGGENGVAKDVQTLLCPIDERIVLGHFYQADKILLDSAVAAARAAAASWSSTSWQQRLVLIRRFADEVEREKFDIAIACMYEVGKSRMEALGEIEEAIDLIRYYSQQMESNNGYERPLERAFPNEETSDLLRPLGVFGVIAPFNFPVALSISMVSCALIAGNTVVYKPGDLSGLTGSLIVKALERAGLPNGTVNLVLGNGTLGAAMVDHPGFDGFAFTGSNRVGMDMLRKVAGGRYNRPVLAEMGGKNPTYVTASADLDVAAEGVMRSAFGLQGQKCSAGSKVYVHTGVAQAFIEKLLTLTKNVVVGDPRRREVFMGPLVNDNSLNRYRQACAEAERDGQLIHGGQQLQGGIFDHGRYVTPAIVVGLKADHRLNRDELFLPFLSVLSFDNFEEAIIDGNSIDYGLTAGCYARNEKEICYFTEHAEAGALYVNRVSGATTGAWPGIQTFCGWKGSGTTSKGGLGTYYLPQFMREQSRTIWRNP